MSIATVHCPVAHRAVARIADLEGATIRVICEEYEEPTGICRLKKSAAEGGPLSQLLERLSEETLDTRTTRCEFAQEM
jgi:hypothetical protein